MNLSWDDLYDPDETEGPEEITVTRGGQRATVTSLGGALRSYEVDGREVIVGFEAGEPTPGMHGAVLAPWPNRLDGGRYVFGGTAFEVPVNEPERNTANHGFAHDLRWSLTSTDVMVKATVELHDLPGYPFPIGLTARYALTEAGLTVTVGVINEGPVLAPFGIGFHPWLSPGDARVDECTLSVDASGWLETDDRLLPVGVRPLPDELNFRTPRRLGTTVLDDCFTKALRDDTGRSWVRLSSPDGKTAAIWSRAPLDYWQLCTGDFPDLGPLARAGVAAEPMSCPANALASGDHLVRLHPERTWMVAWGLCLLDGTP